ncbi:hypothetical protein Dimus_026207 [Dionaea muscipula]
MDLSTNWSFLNPIIFLVFLLLMIPRGVPGAKITFVNKCHYIVWPGILSNAGSPPLESTGFDLPTGGSRSFQAPTGWSGRFWGRTGCNFGGSSSPGFCATGDCGSGQVACGGAGAEPPATLAEFTLGSGGLDFYDVSLVDGYNLPLLVEPSGGSGLCSSTGCAADLNRACPVELKVGDGEACRSACEAFGRPEYCCSGAYGTPATCKPTVYSEMFKSACPRSYSYAYDDPTSTFTCRGADYTITFCPSTTTTSQKSTAPVTPTVSTPTTPSPVTPMISTATPPTPTATPTTPGFSAGPGFMSYDSAGTDQPGSGSGSVSHSGSGSGSASQTTAAAAAGNTLANGSWLAGLAMGDSISTKTMAPSTLQSSLIAAASAAFTLILCSIGGGL